jgi:hypothetical protein
MNLQSTISIYGGGTGSGCNPEKGKCGRHSTGQPIYHGTSLEAAKKILQDGIMKSSIGQAGIPVVYATKNKSTALSFAYGAAEYYGSSKGATEAALVVLKPEAEKELPHLKETQMGAFPKGIKEIDFKTDIPPKYIDRVEVYSITDVGKAMRTPYNTSNSLDPFTVKPLSILHAGTPQSGETYLVVLARGR